MTATHTPAPGRRSMFRRRSAIPGFGLTMGITLAVLSLVVLIPLTAVALKASQQTLPELLQAGFSERALTAYRLSFGAALIAASVVWSQVLPGTAMDLVGRALGERPGRMAGMMVMTFLNIHHFFTDGVLWKLRNPEVRADLFGHVGR